MLGVQESQKVINSYVYRVERRLFAAGAPAHLVEDVKQECWIAWCKARDSYDEASPASFKTYLWNGIRMHINNWIRENVNARHQEIVAKSLDQERTEDGATLANVIPSADPMPDELVMREDLWSYAIKHLPPRAKQFIELLREPPALLLEQVKQLEARAKFAKEKGVAMPFTNRVTTRMVFDLMGATRHEQNIIAAAIKKVGKRMERVSK